MASISGNRDIALPTSFSFYHLGEARGESAPVDGPIIPRSGFGFQIRSESLSALMLLLPSRGTEQDLSVYAEMGNIIASRVAGGLKDGDISPPEDLTYQKVHSLLTRTKPIMRFIYKCGDSGKHDAEVVLIPSPSEVGHG